MIINFFMIEKFKVITCLPWNFHHLSYVSPRRCCFRCCCFLRRLTLWPRRLNCCLTKECLMTWMVSNSSCSLMMKVKNMCSSNRNLTLKVRNNSVTGKHCLNCCLHCCFL